MEPNPTGVMRQVGRVASEADTRADDALLAAFLHRRDDRAFATLLRRHGPLVLGVCRRLLHDRHDVEDAFQASFLVLLRKARSLRRRERLGPWLYGVAYRVALKARFLRARRRATELSANAMTPEPALVAESSSDGVELLDRELLELPESYRLPLILCELQGLSRRDAARQLHLPEGTLSSRLARGRQLLRQRLTRRGVALSAAAVLGLFVDHVRAAVPTSLSDATLLGSRSLLAGAAVAAGARSLMEGVLTEMLLTKLKTTATIVVILASLIGLPALLSRSAAADPPAVELPIPSKPKANDENRLRGVWRLEKVNGSDATAKELKETYGLLIFDNEHVTDGDGRTARAHFNEIADPKEIDWSLPGGPTRQWIYKLSGDSLTMCGKVADIGQERPKKFEPGMFDKKIVVHVMTYRRVTQGPALGPKPMAIDFGFPIVQSPNESCIYMNTRHCAFPFQLAPEKRKPDDTVTLYVSSNAGRSWKEAQTVKADRSEITFEAPRDGEYMVAIELGNQKPTAPSRGLRLVVDTVQPVVLFQCDGTTIRWAIIDKNLDPASIKVEVRYVGDADWRAYGEKPSANGAFRITGAPARPVEVRVFAKDLAGNEVTTSYQSDSANKPQAPAQLQPDVKKSDAPYVIEAPDIIRIEAVVRGSDKQPGKALPQPVAGSHLVRPDGTASLGVYGTVSVAGLTVEKATSAIRDHVVKAAERNDIDVRVEVETTNSKSYYIFIEGRDADRVTRMPFTGNETAHKVVETLKGELEKFAGPHASVSDFRVFIIRPATSSEKAADRVLQLDWPGGALDNRVGNYRLQPGDRVFATRHWLARAESAETDNAANLVSSRLGVTLKPADAKNVKAVNDQLGAGLRIVTMAKEGISHKAGLLPGDVIVGLHHWEMVSLDNVVWVLTHPDRKDFGPLTCWFIRNDQLRRVTLTQRE
jgi:RNA polymerase sigma factor (sigma-70 family)